MPEPAESGAPLAWDTLAPELARLAGALGVDPSRVDDVLQDVRLAALEKPPQGCPADELRRWVFRVTVNRCHLEHRRLARWMRAFRRLVRAAPHQRQADDPATCLQRREEQALVRAALERMPPLVRTVLVLRYFADFDSNQIGMILQMPDSTVRSHLRAGRQRLACELRWMGYDDE